MTTHGKISYLQIPTVDIEKSMAFYRDVFDWSVRKRSDGHLAFDDTTGAVSGEWLTGRPPSGEPGLLLYIGVDDVEAACDRIRSHGGEVVQEVGGDAPEITARFRDPGGNVLGIFQE